MLIISKDTTRDIYSVMDHSLEEADYYYLCLEEKRELVAKDLKEYLILKIRHFAFIWNKLSDVSSYEGCENKSVEELIIEFDSIIDQEEKDEFLSPFSHYMQYLIGTLQSLGFSWEIDNSLPIDEPKLVMKNNRVDALKTHLCADRVKVFLLLFNYFMKELTMPEEYNPTLLKKSDYNKK